MAQSSETASPFDDGLLFGSEFTFGSAELLAHSPSGRGIPIWVQTPYSKDLISRLEGVLREKLAGIAQVDTKNFHSKWSRKTIVVTYPNGFQIFYFSDQGVLEVNTTPTTLNGFRKNRERIYYDIFLAMKAIGLEPQNFTGSGHIHIDTKLLDPITLRNFIVDFWNHTGLAAGALNEDIFNAIGPGEVKDVMKEKYYLAINQFDAMVDPSKGALMQLIHDGPYQTMMVNELDEYLNARGKGRPEKYHAVSGRSFEELGTIEVRALRPQQTPQSYEKLLVLFKRRMEMAQEAALRGERIPLGPLPSLRGNAEEVLRSFHSYVVGAGLNFEDYKEFVLPWWQEAGGEWDQFMAKLPAAHLNAHGATENCGALALAIVNASGT